jgi:hypothetical protein
MTKREAKPAIVANASVNALFGQSPDGLREIVRAVMQEMLEAEMTDALGAHGGSARLPFRLLHPHSRHPGGQARAVRAAGSRRTLLQVIGSKRGCCDLFLARGREPFERGPVLANP